MGGIKTRILPLFRRSSASSAKSTTNSSVYSTGGDNLKPHSKPSLIFRAKQDSIAEHIQEQDERSSPPSTSLPSPQTPNTLPLTDYQPFGRPPTPPRSSLSHGNDERRENPRLTLVEATPDQTTNRSDTSIDPKASLELVSHSGEDSALRKQPLALESQQRFLRNVLDTNAEPSPQSWPQDYFGTTSVTSPSMLHRKIWVKRSGASATLVQINEDDLVDDARDRVLRKYANSLGRTFDSPDVVLRIIPRDNRNTERSLGPEESISRTLDTYFPGGQTVDEALVIEVPHRRTPRPSPRIYSENRPPETGADYFPVMPVALNHSPHLPTAVSVTGSAGSSQQIHSMSVLSTGHIPPLPSPGATSRTGRHGGHRPKFGRTNTSSPTILTTTAPHQESRQIGPPTPSVPTLPTPPLPVSAVSQQKASTPPARVSSPRPSKTSKAKKAKKASVGQLPLPVSLLDGGVPPINVLIVEDNIINLKLLEAFMKRLNVRWHTAMNGKEAVTKWRVGGFHLVLMDIQLPVMNGLDATKEIRRLERVNGIGVLADKVGDKLGGDREGKEAEGNDRLQNQESFKSPVIIVALTASSLQSDRHEALAAGCNDFLTKPVAFLWLERKVMEWGCMQALIDFDGWRKWKEFAQSLPAPGKKGSDAPNASKSSAAAFSSAALPIKTRESASNSNSTGSSDSPSAVTAPGPDALAALNAKTESADTIDSVSTMASTSSVETAAPLASSTTTLTPQTGFQRQPQPQPPKHYSQAHPYSLRPSFTDPNLGSTKQHTHTMTGRAAKEERQRKRSSLGHGGLSGVVEEMEDGEFRRRS